MTVAERKRQLKKHIDKLPAKQLAKAEELILSLDADEGKLTAEDRRKITRMERILAKAEADIAAGRTRNWREIRKDV